MVGSCRLYLNHVVNVFKLPKVAIGARTLLEQWAPCIREIAKVHQHRCGGMPRAVADLGQLPTSITLDPQRHRAS